MPLHPAGPQERLRSPKAGKSPTCFLRRWDDSSSLVLPRINFRSFLKPLPRVAVPWREEQGHLLERLGVIFVIAPQTQRLPQMYPLSRLTPTGHVPVPRPGSCPPPCCPGLTFFLLCSYNLCRAAHLCPIQNCRSRSETALKRMLRDFPICAELNYWGLLQPPGAQPSPSPHLAHPGSPPPASSDSGSHPGSWFPSGPFAAVIYSFLPAKVLEQGQRGRSIPCPPPSPPQPCPLL